MLRRRHLGRVSFLEANDFQRALVSARDDYVLLFEHPPTYTKGVRAQADHFLVAPEDLNAVVVEADRGGDVTYHGPGQIVAWAIVTVSDDPGAGRAHVHRLEEAVVATVRRVDPDGRLGDVGRLEGYPGVWAHLESRPVKIAAVGVRTERDDMGRRRTLHGVALNVDVDLAAFAAIIPCGIPDKPVGSLVSLGLELHVPDVEEILGEELDARLGTEARVARVDRSVATTSAERPMLRRLRKAGVNPDDGLSIRTRKPEWLRIEAHMGNEYQSLRTLTEDLRLVTVCEEAGCPNIFECWSQGTATFMVNGERCTRACGFCLIDTRKPMPLDPSEPERVAEAVVRLNLHHAVITCVARDDLPDGGAGGMAATVRAIREASPDTKVEVLTSDLKGDVASLEILLAAQPDVLNHNVETVARLQRAVRPSAGYLRSLSVLARSARAGFTTKSGLMVGLGESADEVEETLADLAAVGVQIATIGQYLRPTERHLPVARYWEPHEFEDLAERGRRLGLAHVQSSPLTRSSYHAREALSEATPVAAPSRR
ncbi:MAG: lipoyl synthase [Acidobacteriota bacterium]|nr:lipoyl synthase [Acidobacteriota bacterium]MDE3043438.1 lipoyl synthase [Acidobacteriota bacterium]MDE3107035.1 lipoyl synthase [Acidobacteriota bacterium]